MNKKRMNLLTMAFAMFSCMLVSNVAAAFSVSFLTLAEAQIYCANSKEPCSEIVKTSQGFTAYFEQTQNPNSGPKRGDGDGDPLDGGS